MDWLDKVQGHHVAGALFTVMALGLVVSILVDVLTH